MRRTVLAALVGIGLAASNASAAPLYLPTGPQTGVTLATVLAGGWTQCYAATMGTAIGASGQNVLNACQGDYLMMAGRETGANSFMSLAAALRSDTIVDTGHTDNTHLANGSNWWFSSNWSWGFAGPNDTVNLFECDTTPPAVSMCLHTNATVGGYSINNIISLNSSVGYEKVFFVASNNAVPEPASAALVGAGVAGLIAFARRRVGSATRS